VYSNCLDPLRNGQVVAVTTDNVILSGFVAQNEGEFKLAGDGKTFTEEPYGIGLTKGDDEFRNFINDVLEESFDDGTWARLFEQTAGQVLPVPDPPTLDRY
jgi:glutamate transport system substrate-binding protein